MLSTNNVAKSRLIAALNGNVTKSDGGDNNRKLENKITSYVRKKDSSIPRDLYSRDFFEDESGNLSFIKYKSISGELNIVRFSEPDGTVPGRSWVVELTSGVHGEHVMFGCRLYCYARNYDFSFEHSVPRVVRDIVDTVGLHEYGEILTSSPFQVNDENDVIDIINLIRKPLRWRNVVAFSADDGGQTTLSAQEVAKRTAGLAHIVVLSPHASFLLSNNFGKALSVFDRGIRVYRPDFTEDDGKSRHPLILGRQISSGETNSHKQFIQLVVEDCFRSSVERKDLRTNLPSFVDVRAHVSKNNVVNLSSQANGLQLENKLSAEAAARSAAEQQVQAALSMAIQEEEERTKAESQRDYYSAQLNVAQARIEALERRLSSVGNDIYIDENPTSYEQIEQWVEENFVGKLVLHPRVSRGLKDAVYSEISEVCDALSLLANSYRQVLLGGMRREDFDEILRERHLSLSGSISESKAKSFGDEYYVKWREKKHFLHGHIQKGNSREERYCLRIYFFWEPEQQVIVIGWLPSHLKNKLT
ncbi:hypothetical protein C8J31_101495 [Rhizobium sp. PP-CC-2G-626]|nr:hypothetical protein C8J31_101495 [Rhizobium sp. PP-CC-2G-626]